MRLQHHQVDNVDDADTNVRHVFAQQRDGRERLERRHIACAGHHDVGLTRVIAGPLPDAGSCGAMATSRIDVQPLPHRLFAGHNHVNVIAAAQTVVTDRQEAVRIGRQIDAHHIGFFVRDMIDETGILMREAVVVLSPDM